MNLDEKVEARVAITDALDACRDAEKEARAETQAAKAAVMAFDAENPEVMPAINRAAGEAKILAKAAAAQGEDE